MNIAYIIIAVVLVLAIWAVILVPMFARRKRSERFQNQYGTEYDRTVQTAGSEKKAQAELNDRRKHVATLKIRPLSDFEHRAADVSVQYPALVSNYRAAREVAILNEQHHAGTEDLRQAMIHYRSLFDELLKADAVAPAKKTS